MFLCKSESEGDYEGTAAVKGTIKQDCDIQTDRKIIIFLSAGNNEAAYANYAALHQEHV